MKSLLKQLVGESAIYGLSGIISRFISIFLVPLYTSIFVTADYGVMNLIGSFFFFVNIFVVFALDNSAARWYYDSTDEKDQKSTISTWFWFQMMASIVSCGIVISLSGILTERLLERKDPWLFIIPSLSVITNAFTTVVGNWFRMRRKALLTVIFNLSFSILTILLTIYFVLYLRKGVIGVFYAALVSNALSSIVCIFLLKDWISSAYFSLSRLKEMLRFAMPLIPTSLSFWVLTSSAPFILNEFCDIGEVGLFQMGLTISSAVALFTSAFQMAWGPFAYSIMAKENAKEIYSVVLSIYCILANIIALTVSLFAEDILILLTHPNYYDAYLVAGILTFNATLYSYVYILEIGNGISKNTKPLAIATFLSASVTIAILFILTPIFGKTGTALAMILGNLIIPVYVYRSAQKSYPINYNIGLVCSVCIAAGALYTGYIFLRTDVYVINLLIKISMILFFVIILIFALKRFEPVVISKVKAYLNKKQLNESEPEIYE